MLPLPSVNNRRVLDLARTQHGVVSRRQLLELGVSSSQIGRAVRRGRLARLLRGIFLMAPALDTFLSRCFAVQLRLDGVGVLTGRTAGRLHGLSRMGTEPLQCMVPTERVLDLPPWVEVHRSRWYRHDRRHTQLPNGLIVANPQRTLFSLAAFTLTQRRFNHIADDAWNLGLVAPDGMAEYLDRHRCRGKDGVAFLESWIERSLDETRPTQSYFERDLLDALDRAGLPTPHTQFPIDLQTRQRIHLDIAWPAVRLGIEPGHSRFHDPAADAARDLACAELGWVVHRLTEHARSDLDRFAHLIARAHRRRWLDLQLPTLPDPRNL